MKTLKQHMNIYKAQNKERPFTPKQRRRLFQTYRCRTCGAFGEQPCMTEGGKVTTSKHRKRPV